MKGLTDPGGDRAVAEARLTRVGALLNTVLGVRSPAGVDGFIHTQIAKIVASQQFARLWVGGQPAVHAQLVKALSGQGNGAITSATARWSEPRPDHRPD